jgi:hypothetical protein
MSDDTITPRCGLYRTTRALPEGSDTVAAGQLVYFHNHSDQGPPLLLLPKSNRHNRWQFHDRGHHLTDADLTGLEPLKPEGLYRLREHFHPDDNHVVAANALVQLGYNRAAEPIIFFPRTSQTDNGVVFPSQGTRIGQAVYQLLEPLDLRGPYHPTPLH